MRIKAISLWQPWASLIAIGAKKFETRGWPTPHRGPLAIHAAKRWTHEQWELCQREPFAAALKVLAGEKHPTTKGYIHTLPLGFVVATARLTNVYHTETVMGKFLHPDEKEFGNFNPGRFAWELVDVVPLKEPVPCQGRQGFFWVELEDAA